MTPRSDDPRPAPLDPEVEGLLVDRARGELEPSNARRLEALLRERPGLDADARGIEAFLRAARDAQDERPEPGQAERVVARIRARTESEAARARREALAGARPRRIAWARLLAASVALHVALLAVVVFKARQAEVAAQGVRISVQLPAPGILPAPDEGYDAPPSPWLPAPGDFPFPEARLAEVEPGATGPTEDDRLAPLAEDRFAFAPTVAGPMQVRTHDDLKRGRLHQLGFDPDGTLGAVARGLRALQARQAANGSFPAGGGRGAVGQTALALLPFLGEGHGSRTGDELGREVVARGVAWVRRQLFAEGGNDVPAADLGIALKALAEDYMLSYGKLRPAEAERRVDELTRLTERVVATQAPDGRFPGADDDIRLAVWPMWGLEAAARTGVVLPPAAVAERFVAWYASRERRASEDVAAGLLLARSLGDAFEREAAAGASFALAEGSAAEDDTFVLVATGTGLLLRDPEAFRTWGRGLDAKLERGLLQTGVAREGDPVGDTATILLALQVGYRTY